MAFTFNRNSSKLNRDHDIYLLYLEAYLISIFVGHHVLVESAEAGGCYPLIWLKLNSHIETKCKEYYYHSSLDIYCSKPQFVFCSFALVLDFFLSLWSWDHLRFFCSTGVQTYDGTTKFWPCTGCSLSDQLNILPIKPKSFPVIFFSSVSNVSSPFCLRKIGM